MDQAASQILRAIRGRRSQVAFARRLGYRANPITDWERGESFPTAEEALRAAALLRIDVSAAVRRFAPGLTLRKRGSRFLLADWLSELRGSASLAELAARCACSRFAVSRWLRGQAKPRLPEFLQLLEAISGRAADFVAELVPIAQVPALEPRYRAAQAAKRLAFELPWTEAILRLLETQAYRQAELATESSAAWVARQLGIPLELSQSCLRAAMEAGALTRQGARYLTQAPTTVDTQGGKQALHRLKQHWSSVAMERTLLPRDADFFAYNVASVSRADLGTIRERLRSTFREIRSLIAASSPEQVVAIINLQVTTFDPIP